MPKISITPSVADPYIVKNLKVSMPRPKKEPAKKKKTERSKIIAVDFDGTLHDKRFPYIGAPNSDLINTLLLAQNCGAKLILWTCRSGSFLQAAVDWCKTQGIVFDAVNDNVEEVQKLFRDNTRKVFADIYVDDCSCRGDELCRLLP